MTLVDFTHRFVERAPEGPPATLLLLHGTGGNEDDLLPLGRQLLPGAALLSPRGKILEQGQPRFFRRFAEGVFDTDDLIARTHELARFVEAAVKEYHVETTKLVAVGYSNGANIAASMLLLEPNVLAGAVLFRAMVPLVPPTLPDLKAVSVFLSAGRMDPIVPADNTRQLGELLSRAGARVDLRWMDAGHSLTAADVEAAREWLTRAIT